MLKSVLVPGWGQATNGSWIKAGLAAGLEGYLIAGAVQAGRDVRRIRASSDTTSLADAQDRKVKYVWWTIGATCISMLDAFVDAHFKNFDVTPIAKRDFPGDDTWLGVRVSFPVVRR
jgi:hypothetical protein